MHLARSIHGIPIVRSCPHSIVFLFRLDDNRLERIQIELINKRITLHAIAIRINLGFKRIFCSAIQCGKMWKDARLLDY